ncbi:hypothetical protein [Mesorhizobium sp. M0058]|uniref:hypothetical protein n=1 Tax=Mesorhizobium sp. M0058 TaxID=2956865 RepID=UPI00333816D4
MLDKPDTIRPPGILDALAMWAEWHADMSPLGPTGDYGVDMQLADAFRAMLYRPALKDRLAWIEREIRRPRRRLADGRYPGELCAWWLDLWEAEKAPLITNRIHERKLHCVSFS